MFVIKNNEKLMICPFDKNHMILPLRYESHVRKCSIKHTTMPEICPFDSKHHVLKGELRHHLTVCPSKYRLEKELVHQHNRTKKLEKDNGSDISSSNCDVSSVEQFQQLSTENWDNEIDFTVVPTKTVKTERLAYTNKTKSEKKKDREQAIEEFKKKQSEKSESDDLSSLTDANSSRYVLNSGLSTITENDHSDMTMLHKLSIFSNQDDDMISTRGSTISSSYSRPLGRGQSFHSKLSSIITAGSGYMPRSTIGAEYDSNSVHETLSIASTETQPSYASAIRQSKLVERKLFGK